MTRLRAISIHCSCQTRFRLIKFYFSMSVACWNSSFTGEVPWMLRLQDKLFVVVPNDRNAERFAWAVRLFLTLVYIITWIDHLCPILFLIVSCFEQTVCTVHSVLQLTSLSPPHAQYSNIHPRQIVVWEGWKAGKNSILMRKRNLPPCSLDIFMTLWYMPYCSYLFRITSSRPCGMSHTICSVLLILVLQ